MLPKENYNKNFFTKERIIKIRKDTGMDTYDAYEILGDAVYDVIFYNYMWRRRVPLDIYLLGRSKSNITMSCIMMKSEIQKWIRVVRTDRGPKASADTLESLIGMAFSHLVDSGHEVTETLETWMTEVFDIGGILDALVSRRTTPSGSYILPSKEVDILPLYKLSIQKLVMVYYLFLRYKHRSRASYMIHQIYDPYREKMMESLNADIDNILDNDDILLSSTDLSSYMNLQ
jgi:hypothetical protein